MRLSRKNWNNYVTRLSAINKTAGRKMLAYIEKHGTDDVDALVEYAYALATKYGEAASAVACEMYDEIATIQNAHVPPAVPKQPQNIKYVDAAVRGALSRAPSTVPSTVSELVKRTGAETTLKNAKRDGAYFAWVPNGDTCAFCITLASNGWRRASKKTINGDHAEHIHKNCDCEFAISFKGPGEIEGYDPNKYLAMYEGAEGSSWKDKVNSMRRAHYAANKDMINAQKRAAYASRMGHGIGRIAMPIESRQSVGKPAGIVLFGDRLSKRQEKLLAKLQKYDDKVEVDKREVSLKDLAALSAHENVEFAVFTKKGKRLIIRGSRNNVNIDENKMEELARLGYKWSGHTHPVTNSLELVPSEGDRKVLRASGRKYSVIYNSAGKKYVFGIEEKDDIGFKD